jgi:hypothetical protein
MIENWPSSLRKWTGCDRKGNVSLACMVNVPDFVGRVHFAAGSQELRAAMIYND